MVFFLKQIDSLCIHQKASHSKHASKMFVGVTSDGSSNNCCLAPQRTAPRGRHCGPCPAALGVEAKSPVSFHSISTQGTYPIILSPGISVWTSSKVDLTHSRLTLAQNRAVRNPKRVLRLTNPVPHDVKTHRQFKSRSSSNRR